MTKITKIKNFEGYVNNCNSCGREIKHAFKVEGQRGLYGSECIYRIAGIDRKSAKKQVKEQMDNYKTWLRINENPHIYNLESYIKIYGSVDRVESVVLRNGRLC